jgi:hypothetical protein
MGHRRTHLLCALLVAFLALTFVAVPALAWNDAGHRIIAMVAYRQLEEDTRTAVLELLRKHERFDEDFTNRMPKAISSADQEQKDRWIFAQAAIWPDLARGFRGDDKKRFHHGTWHYINLPLFLSDEDATAIGNPPVNLSREWWSGMRSRKMNLMQALAKCKARLTRPQTSKREKALHLCWLFHLVGDLHQPMHSTALFSQDRFPEGDKGGNSIPLVRGRNLHSLWDGLLGSRRLR